MPKLIHYDDYDYDYYYYYYYYYLLYNNAVFNDRLLFKQTQSSTETDVIEVKKHMPL